MPVHTFEIIQAITEPDMLAALSLFKFPQKRIEDFLLSTKSVPSIKKTLSYINPGFKDILFFKNSTTFPSAPFYCVIRLEPLAFIQKKRTINVFDCTRENNELLQNNFHQTMRTFLGDAIPQLTALNCWNCRRIDYTENLRFASLDEVTTFLDLTKKTSLYLRSQQLNLPIKTTNASTAEGNKSYKFMIYDKQRQVSKTYTDIPAIEKEGLWEASHGIARLEIQCQKGKVQSIAKNLPSRAIFNYLDESIAGKIIHQHYQKAVHYGNFYSLYYAKKKIADASLSSHKQKQLIQFLQLIAQTRHLDKAKEQFLTGTKIKRTPLLVKGSANTFRKRLQELAELNINPMLLTKESKLKFFQNPLQIPNASCFDQI